MLASPSSNPAPRPGARPTGNDIDLGHHFPTDGRRAAGAVAKRQQKPFSTPVVSHSKTAENAKDDLLGVFWQWVRPLFLTDAFKVEAAPNTPKTAAQVDDKLLELVKDKAFFQELVKRVAALQQAGIKEKNFVRKDIQRVKVIRIGDKDYAPGDVYDRKNIVEGSVTDADSFSLGDGH